MIPENTLSTAAAISGFSFPVKGPLPEDKLQDWELAGRYLNDSSAGLQVKLWHVRLEPEEESNVIHVIVSAPGGVDVGEPERILFSGVDITEVALTFDQNMNPFVAYMQDGDAKIWWYDPTVPGMTHTTLPAGSYDLRCTLDDKRSFNVGESDIVLSYIRSGTLYVRYQRERYDTEHVLRAGIGANARLVSMAMNRDSRMQWRLRNYALTDDPGALLQADPFLADVVADLLRRSDVKPEHIDTDELWVPIEGYRIANQGGADSNIAPLTQAWFFDPGEWDKKLRFIMRGGEPVVHLTFDDLLEREDSPFQIDRVQEMELLRKVNVTMVDSTAGWIANKQTAERRSATIKAVGEQSTIMPITAHPDFTATVATKRLRIPWGEPYKFKFALGTPWSALTPTDIVTMTDRRGRKHTIRLGQIDEDYGKFDFESTNNAGWIYEQTAIGTGARPWNPTVPGQVGETTLIVLDIPTLYDQDDELGYYVAVLGEGDGWRGAQAQMRIAAFGGPRQSWELTSSSTVGKVTTPLLPERDGEYLSNQKFHVQMLDGQLASATREGVLNGANMAAVQRADGTWEMMQFQTATSLGNGLYELSGLVRGRYATEPEAVAEDGWFVLIDGSVSFVRVQRSMLGRRMLYRAISYGSNADDVEWSHFDVENPKAQDEWPVHMLQATRDGGTVTTTWIDRGRLGSDLAPYHSKYFDGFSVRYSDGPSYKVTDGSNTHVRTGVPANTTITVSPLNRATRRIGRGRSITV